MRDTDIRPVSDRDRAGVETAITAAVPHAATRRALLDRAGKALAVVGGGAVLGATAGPAFAGAGDRDTRSRRGERVENITSALATFEVFGVTFLTEAIRRAPGTPSAQFVPVLKAANSSEYAHLRALRKIDAKPRATRVWLPEALFGAGGIGLFESIEIDEAIEISAYLVGVTTFARNGDEVGARLCAEALGTEAVHRALARDAQRLLGGVIVPAANDRGFERFVQRTGGSALRALEAVGVGFGKQGTEPGRFYDFPGDPLDNGVGADLRSTRAR